MAQAGLSGDTSGALSREGGKENGCVSEHIAPSIAEVWSGVGMEGMGNC